ncbi:hypothetical protein SUDANB108_05378 [Streptomyces sp. enrichment culture]
MSLFRLARQHIAACVRAAGNIMPVKSRHDALRGRCRVRLPESNVSAKPRALPGTLPGPRRAAGGEDGP